jgi:hypothetical protein
MCVPLALLLGTCERNEIIDAETYHSCDADAGLFRRDVNTEEVLLLSLHVFVLSTL